jgi:hypothetical protein
MAHNRYYIINNDDPNKDAIMQYVAQTGQPQRYNLEKTKIVIKLHEEDHEDHPELADYQEYNYKEILIALDNNEWVIDPFSE